MGSFFAAETDATFPRARVNREILSESHVILSGAKDLTNNDAFPFLIARRTM